MSESLSTQCQPNQLWVPGMHLDEEFPTPTEAELVDSWASFTGRPTISTSEVFGALSEPTQKITGIASVDLCEVVRRTAASFDLAIGEEPHDRGIYEKYDWLANKTNNTGFGQSVVVSIVRVLMNNGHVKPREDISEVRNEFLTWRQKGVYIIANTSTLPGCELGTINDFANLYNLSGCFDGILLPRNHDGTGSKTKAGALVGATKDLGLNLSDIPVVHIDDSLHHIKGFLDHSDMVDHKLGLFIPTHADNAREYTDMQCPTTIDAVHRATDFFRKAGLNI